MIYDDVQAGRLVFTPHPRFPLPWLQYLLDEFCLAFSVLEVAEDMPRNVWLCMEATASFTEFCGSVDISPSRPSS